MLPQVELFLALGLTAIALVLHGVFLTHAGGFWRDEAGFLRISTLPSMGELWRMLTHGSSPVLVPAAIRTWSAAGLGETDLNLRLFGLCAGLVLLVCLWGAGWMIRRGCPLLSLVLVAAQAPMVRHVDSLRPYGLGGIFNVLTLALIWRATKKASVANVVLAGLMALLSVQCLYQNAFFVLAACCAGMGICAVNRCWRDAVCLLLIGLVSAVSLIPYVGSIVRSQDWWILQQVGFFFSEAWKGISRLTVFPPFWVAAMWIILGLLAVWAVAARKASATEEERGDKIFWAVTLVVGFLGYIAFLEISRLPTNAWHYTPLLIFSAVCLDALIARAGRWARLAVIALAMATVICAWPLGGPVIKQRQSNLDMIAARLEAEAGPDDYIIMHPWYYCISFSRYYHGAAAWTTLPPLEDYTIHRYDQLKTKLQQAHPVRPVQERIVATLRGGHRVWVIGWLQTKPMPDPNPAPNNEWGWYDDPYLDIWASQTGYLLANGSEHITTLPPVTKELVNPQEDPPLILVTGWKGH